MIKSTRRECAGTCMVERRIGLASDKMTAHHSAARFDGQAPYERLLQKTRAEVSPLS